MTALDLSVSFCFENLEQIKSRHVNLFLISPFAVGEGGSDLFKSKRILSMESINILVCLVMCYASVSDTDDFF